MTYACFPMNLETVFFSIVQSGHRTMRGGGIFMCRKISVEPKMIRLMGSWPAILGICRYLQQPMIRSFPQNAKKSKKREIANDLQILIDLFHVCSITYTIVRKNSGCSWNWMIPTSAVLRNDGSSAALDEVEDANGWTCLVSKILLSIFFGGKHAETVFFWIPSDQGEAFGHQYLTNLISDKCVLSYDYRAVEGLRRDLYILSSEPYSKELRQIRDKPW